MQKQKHREEKGKKPHKDISKKEKEKIRNSIRHVLNIYYVLHDLPRESSNSKE